MEEVIKVNHLNKQIGTKKVLHDISFTVSKGECIALIGPNGAGKTTLFSCLLGDYSTEKTMITVLKDSPRSKKLKDKVSVLYQENIIQKRMKVKELISFYRSIYNNPLSLQEVDNILRFSELQKNQFTEKLSGGQKRLLSFLLAVIGNPQIIFLDEPTAGMDTNIRQHFWKVISLLKKQGKTIIYSSHYIEEVEHTADRVLLLNKGQLIRDTTPYALRSEKEEKVFSIPIKYVNLVRDLTYIYDVELKKDNICFTTQNPQKVWDIIYPQVDLADIEMNDITLLKKIFTVTEDK